MWILRIFLFVFGTAIVILTPIGCYWLLAMACAMNTTGCREAPGLSDMAAIGIWTLPLMAIGAGMIFAATRLAPATRHHDTGRDEA